MAEPKKYWFIKRQGVRSSFPVAWQGWAWLFGVFALEVAVTRELIGISRVLAFFAVLLGFYTLARGRTEIVPRDPY